MTNFLQTGLAKLGQISLPVARKTLHLVGTSDEVTTAIQNGLGEIYRILLIVVLPIAAIACAICAVKMIWGDTRAAEAAKQTLIRIVIGVGIVFLAPILITTVSGWFESLDSGHSSIWG